MALGDLAAILISVYAYPRSNPMRAANEEMFTDLFGWMSTLTMPTLLGGDFNEVRDESKALSLIYRLDLFFLSPNLPTTRSKTGALRKGQAIDHCIGNMKMRECIAWAEPNYERSLSDHFPLEGTSRLRERSCATSPTIRYGIGPPLYNLTRVLLIMLYGWVILTHTWSGVQ